MSAYNNLYAQVLIDELAQEIAMLTLTSLVLLSNHAINIPVVTVLPEFWLL